MYFRNLHVQFCRWSCLTNSANIFPFIAFAIYLLPIKAITAHTIHFTAYQVAHAEA